MGGVMEIEWAGDDTAPLYLQLRKQIPSFQQHIRGPLKVLVLDGYVRQYYPQCTHSIARWHNVLISSFLRFNLVWHQRKERQGCAGRLRRQAQGAQLLPQEDEDRRLPRLASVIFIVRAPCITSPAASRDDAYS